MIGWHLVGFESMIPWNHMIWHSCSEWVQATLPCPSSLSLLLSSVGVMTTSGLKIRERGEGKRDTDRQWSCWAWILHVDWMIWTQIWFEQIMLKWHAKMFEIKKATTWHELHTLNPFHWGTMNMISRNAMSGWRVFSSQIVNPKAVSFLLNMYLYNYPNIFLLIKQFYFACNLLLNI